VHADSSQEHPQELLDRAIRGELGSGERMALERHAAECSMCAFELEASRVFREAVAPGKQDEALYRAVVNGAMERLQRPQPLGNRLHRWLGSFRGLRPIGFATLGLAAAVALGLVLFHSHQPAPSLADSRPLILNDGSEITPATASTAVQVEEQSPTRTAVRLRSGSAQFRVPHDAHRRFHVNAGVVEIEDLGTVFRVTHEAGGKVQVAVSEGRVSVRHLATGSRVQLVAGESRTFEPQPVAVQAPDPQPVAAQAQEAPKEPPRPTETPSLAGASPSSTSRVRGSEDPAALLQAADLARRTHNPQAAVASLRRLVDKYPKDPRAPSAAFTLGWELLTDLGRPREAAVAFEEAERRASRGILAEDATARVAEAWQRAGDSHRAAEAARRYQRLYPTGRHLSLMRALAGEP
jgi:ferric-dicitrate binding protein FerR (iron transport regulator)